MRIALVNKAFDARLGGGEVYACKLAEGLIARGHELTLVSQTVHPDLQGPFEHIQVTPRPVRRGRRVLAFSQAVDQVLDRGAHDIVHGLTQIFPQDVHRAGGGVFRYWQRVSTPNAMLRFVFGLSSRSRIQRWVEDQIYAPGNYHMIQTNSQLVAGHIHGNYGVPREQIEVIYNGVDLERFHPRLREAAGQAVRQELGIGAADPVVLFVGNNSRRKGLDRLGRAMAMLPDASRVHLLVVGRGKRRHIRRALARHPGPCKWVGAKEDVSPYYGAADLFVLPTRYDPFANVSLEALASGLAVVTTLDNGAGELLTRGEDGVVSAEPDDPRQLADAIEMMLDQRGPALIERARRTAEAYPWSRNVDAVERLYERVVAAKNQTNQNVGETAPCPS